MTDGGGGAPRDPRLLPLLHDFIDAATRGVGDAALFARLCDDLLRTGAGVPVWRAALQLENLHPLYYGYCLHWLEGEAAGVVERSHAFAASEAFATSPYVASLRAGGGYRCRVEAVAEPELPLLRELKTRGVTDFIAEIIAPAGSLPPGVTWATRRPGGFADADAALLRALGPHLALAFGLGAERRKVEAVLRTYLGAGPSREVLEGRVRRGEVRRLEAVVLLADLRGFSTKTATWDEAELLDALGAYFETVVDAVASRGGDVLKFLGDGVLAVFPITPGDGIAVRCRDAAAAVRTARAALARVNAGRVSRGVEALDFTAALHVGPLAHGNVGARERLDFTVIGPAANVAARLEALAKRLGEPTVATDDVARHLERDAVRPLGAHALPGLPGRFDLFAC